MSKVARKPINLPEKTQLKIDNNHITIEGPLGSLEFTKNDGIKLIQEDNLLSVQTDKLDLTALSGTTRALLFNMVHGVSIGWKKSLKWLRKKCNLTCCNGHRFATANKASSTHAQ